MPRKANDYTGRKIEKLTFIKRLENSPKNHVQWLCKCDCGNERIVNTAEMSYKSMQFCCNECKVQRKKSIHVNGKPYNLHGMKNTPLYKIWASMKIRCQNEGASRYERYGGRGITICNEWINENGFMNFYNWAMASGYEEGLTLDRINVDGNYEPSNCRWVTMREQQNNRSNNLLLTYNGKTKTASQWEDETGIKQGTISARIRNGWSVERALTEKPWGRSVKNAEKNKP